MKHRADVGLRHAGKFGAGFRRDARRRIGGKLPFGRSLGDHQSHGLDLGTVAFGRPRLGFGRPALRGALDKIDARVAAQSALNQNRLIILVEDVRPIDLDRNAYFAGRIVELDFLRT